MSRPCRACWLARLLLEVVLVALLTVGSIGRATAQSADDSQFADGSQFIVVRDAETETLLRNFANPLFRAAGVDPNLVRIILLRDDAINSFVSTGNRMFINTGLIAKAESASELVGAIAHETGHIRGGHLARLPEAMRDAMLETLAATLFGAAVAVGGGGGNSHAPVRDSSAANAGIGAVLGGQQLAMRNFLGFNRIIEASADQGAVQFLDRVHWSARGMLDLFRRLQDETLLSAALQDPYVQTHPLTQSRIAFIEDHLARGPYADAALPPGFEAGFQMVKAKLIGFLTPSSRTLQRYSATDRSPPARYARAIALYRLGQTAPALQLIDGLLAEQPSSPWFHELKGQVLFEAGRVREALVPYRAAAHLAPEQPQIRSALARAMIEVGDPALLRPAIGELESALAREPDDGDSWHALSIAWGRAGKIGQADLALAEEAMLNGDIRMANLWAGKAGKLLPPGPAKMRAGDISNAVKRENRKGF